MVLEKIPLFVALCLALLLFCCTQVERDNPYDPDGVKFNSGGDEPSSGSSAGISYGSVSYGGQTYKTVLIGTQTWFAENLNYNVSGSKCYENYTANCGIYGRLYDWATAMALPSSCNTTSCASEIQSPHQGICPDGWHIPSSEDWGRLSRYVDGTSGTFAGYGSSTAGRYLKATSGWNSNGNDGTDGFGFSALPGGSGIPGGSFRNVGLNGYWWSANEYVGYSDIAYRRYMVYSGGSAYWDDGNKSNLYSVRCLEDSK